MYDICLLANYGLYWDNKYELRSIGIMREHGNEQESHNKARDAWHDISGFYERYRVYG